MKEEEFDTLLHVSVQMLDTLKRIEMYLQILADHQRLSRAGPQAAEATGPLYYDSATLTWRRK